MSQTPIKECGLGHTPINTACRYRYNLTCPLRSYAQDTLSYQNSHTQDLKDKNYGIFLKKPNLGIICGECDVILLSALKSHVPETITEGGRLKKHTEVRCGKKCEEKRDVMGQK